MNTQKKSLKAVLLLLISACNLVACSESSNDEGSEPEIINEPVALYSYLSNNEDYSILVEAINQIGYQDALNVDKAGSYTFFAPNNEAFKRYLDDNGVSSIQNVPTSLLTQIILNHMLNGPEKKLKEIPEGYNKTQAKEYPSLANIDVFVSKNNDTVTLNDGILVTKEDIDVTNGVIHQIDDVIVPATLATFIKVDPAFSNLYDASEQINSEISDKLHDAAAEITLFVPSEDAFLTMGTVTFEKLEKTLKYHIIDGKSYPSTKLVNDMTLDTWQGSSIKISVKDAITITDISTENATVISKDIVAWNGIAHVIDKVLKYE
ncbi:fasciclin domain-containing protein [Joostella atrarenae]|uniref:Fasciclin domain-containing protein n=1 Tax=Joostella atrarenae TaxID=679257 RepID=A0ABS9J432_9FLAO|nr:fasciclin domain-containing protein [Joostella atrarenae]MCF8715186.1 fasciclin domain-containing protein [Joostella atrarenae]